MAGCTMARGHMDEITSAYVATNLKMVMALQHYNRSTKGKEAFFLERRSGQPQWSADLYEGSRRHQSGGGDGRFNRRPPRSHSCSPAYEDRGRPRRRKWDHDVYKSRSPMNQGRRPGEFVESILFPKS